MKTILKKENKDWDKLSYNAWSTRENAYLIGKTKVGSSILSETGRIYSGCNIEHRFRCHDVHAEVNSITHLVAAGDREIVKIIIVAERNFFSPCGSCMDWIMQFATSKTQIGVQKTEDGVIHVFTPEELMPHYPS